MAWPEPLFVLAAPYCGAARVAAMLGQHRCGYALPELNLFLGETVGALLATFHRAEAPIGDGLLRTLAQLDAGAQTEASIAQAQLGLEAQPERRSADLAEALFARLAPRCAVLPDVSAGWRPHELDALIERHPQARILHLVRHPRLHGETAVADLSGRLFIAPDWKDHAGGVAIVDPQLAWLRINRNLGACQVLGETRYRRLRIEDLQTDPADTLHGLCDWLGWPADPAELAAMQHPERSEFLHHGPANAPFGCEADVLEAPAFVAAPAVVPPLDAPPPWRGDARPFAAEVIELARRYGYT